MKPTPLLAAIAFLSVAPAAIAQQADAPPQGYLPPQPSTQPPAPALPPALQPLPQPSVAPQGYPQQPGPVPPPQVQAPQYPPQQPYPGQPLPQAYPQQQPYPGQPLPQGYPQQQPYPGQPLPPPVPPPPPPKADDGLRGSGELAFMYGAGVGYGIGTGVWIDALGKVDDPGLAIIAPIAFGVAVPAGMAIWDNVGRIHKGVPASVGTGLMLGAMEGIAIAGTNWQLTRASSNQWAFGGNASLTWVTATVGGVGGYLFGEFGQPAPQSMALISSGAGWGALAGSLFGAGITGTCDSSSPYASDRYCAWNGAAIGGLVAMNLGIAGAGIASLTGYVPSSDTMKWQWIGFGAGVLATTPIYLVYAFSDSDPKHGLVANAIGGVAGLSLATIFTLGDNSEKTTKAAAWTPPFQLSLAPVKGGMTLGATGTW